MREIYNTMVPLERLHEKRTFHCSVKLRSVLLQSRPSPVSWLAATSPPVGLPPHPLGSLSYYQSVSSLVHLLSVGKTSKDPGYSKKCLLAPRPLRGHRAMKQSERRRRENHWLTRGSSSWRGESEIWHLLPICHQNGEWQACHCEKTHLSPWRHY